MKRASGGILRPHLNLFMFFVLTLVLAEENFLLVFVGWEGVGLASYLLIGFYFARNSQQQTPEKAFVVNRIGDFGFLLAMFLVIANFGTLSFQPVFDQIALHPEMHGGVLTAIALCLVLGATGKSAQIPLYIWLPDAMEGPTPVSALIHAATMVTAGVYMTARCHAIFNRSPLALSVVALIGAATCIFAATIGMAQTDIEESWPIPPFLSWATCSWPAGSPLFRRHLPPGDVVLQGTALPRRRIGDPRLARRTGHAPYGRPEIQNPHHFLDDDRRCLCDLRDSPAGRLRQQRRMLYPELSSRAE